MVFEGFLRLVCMRVCVSQSVVEVSLFFSNENKIAPGNKKSAKAWLSQILHDDSPHEYRNLRDEF